MFLRYDPASPWLKISLTTASNFIPSPRCLAAKLASSVRLLAAVSSSEVVNPTVKDAVVRHCDSDALQAVVSRALREKRNVFFPAGHYRLTSGLSVANAAGMVLEGASGWLVGEPNKGLNAMFVMMNGARLAVGVQGLGITEAAYQNAVAYARERIQSRSLTGAKAPGKPADPIIVHPDVRRMLLTARAFAEGGRAFAYWTALQADIQLHHPDEDRRRGRLHLPQAPGAGLVHGTPRLVLQPGRRRRRPRRARGSTTRASG